MSVITLTTDFGTKDNYVGVMKGVILGINPSVCLVDITHEIAPQQVREAAFLLLSSYRWFPSGTVHLVVVDPGVGGKRNPIIVETERHLFVGPDNGVFSLIYEREQEFRVFKISNPQFLLPKVSNTFHGRDIFAPAAAYLSKGTPPSRLGEQINRYVRFPFTGPEIREDVLEGEIIHIDRFGSLVTNISEETWKGFVSRDKQEFQIIIKDKILNRICHTYSDVPQGELLVVIGSSGFLDISANCASAAEMLSAKPGETVRVKRSP